MSSSADTPRRSRGLAAERTSLAWNRSALAMIATGGSVAKAGADGGRPNLAFAAAALLVVLAAAVWIAGSTTYARDPRDGSDPQQRRRRLRLVTGASVATSAVAFVLVVLS